MSDFAEPIPIRRLFHHVMGWVALMLGIALIGAIVIAPAREELAEAKWYVDFVEVYAKRHHEQVRNYERFSSALAAGDPVVLSRLAFTHLRLKPEGAEMVSVPQADFGNTSYNLSDQPVFVDSTDNAGDMTATDRYHLALIEQWLHTSDPVVGVDHPRYEPATDVVSRLATGSARLPLLAIGGLLVWAGLMMPGPLRVESDDAESNEESFAANDRAEDDEAEFEEAQENEQGEFWVNAELDEE